MSNAPFEPLESLRILILKVTLLLALMSLKRVGDLQAISEVCMDFAPGLSPRFYPHRFALMWSRFTPFILLPLLQVRTRRFTCSVCPIALKIYVDRSKLWRKSPQLLVCCGTGRRGLATSKQNFSLSEGRYFAGL